MSHLLSVENEFRDDRQLSNLNDTLKEFPRQKILLLVVFLHLIIIKHHISSQSLNSQSRIVEGEKRVKISKKSDKLFYDITYLNYIYVQ